MNDALFQVFLAIFRIELLTKAIIVLLIGVWCLHLLRREIRDPRHLMRQMFMAMALLMICLPTQFPWYSIWIFPFLAICPQKGLLLLTPMLSLYYLRYYFEHQGQVEIFDNYIVWIEFLPVWGYLLWTAYLSRQGNLNHKTRMQVIS